MDGMRNTPAARRVALLSRWWDDPGSAPTAVAARGLLLPPRGRLSGRQTLRTDADADADVPINDDDDPDNDMTDDEANIYAPLLAFCRPVAGMEEDGDERALRLVASLKVALAAAHDGFTRAFGARLAAYHDVSRLIIRTSTIPGAGRGLFAACFFEPGDVVCFYTGVVWTWSAQQRLKDRSYLLFLGHNETFSTDIFVDPRTTPSVKARYINDPRNPRLYNVRWETTPSDTALFRCPVVATRAIAAGDEIFVDYGESFWRSSTVAANRLTDDRQARTPKLEHC